MSRAAHHTVADLAREHCAFAGRQVARGRMKQSTAGEIARLYARAILPELAGYRLEDVTERICERWHAERAASAPVDANRAASALRAGLNLAARWGWTTGPNPLGRLSDWKAKEEPRRRVLNDAEWAGLTYLLVQCMESPSRYSTEARVILLLMATGARRSEIENLTYGEIRLDDDDPRLELADSKTGPKTITLGEDAVELLAGHLGDDEKALASADQPVFPDLKLRAAWEFLRSLADLKDVTLHDLRRTFCTRLADQGVSIEDVAALVGQSTVAVQARHYRHISPKRKRELAASAFRVTPTQHDDKEES